jgi:hypothetical protein
VSSRVSSCSVSPYGAAPGPGHGHCSIYPEQLTRRPPSGKLGRRLAGPSLAKCSLLVPGLTVCWSWASPPSSPGQPGSTAMTTESRSAPGTVGVCAAGNAFQTAVAPLAGRADVAQQARKRHDHVGHAWVVVVPPGVAAMASYRQVQRRYARARRALTPPTRCQPARRPPRAVRAPERAARVPGAGNRGRRRGTHHDLIWLPTWRAACRSPPPPATATSA